MKNFLRALHFAWPYRGRLCLSVLCAFFAAIFWSLNFTAIYPVLTILSRDQTLLQFLESRIDETQKDVDTWHATLERSMQEFRDLDNLPDSPLNDKKKRTLTNEMAKLEGKINLARTTLYHYQLAKHYTQRFLPDDRFQTLAWLIGLVVLAVAIKGFFEFWQESLVGSVVNLSLYDLRNRFYRNVIRQDVSQFSESGTHELMARFTNDMEQLGLGCKVLFGRVVAEPLRAFCCILVALWISWQLTLMFLILVPIAGYILSRVGRMMKRATRRLLERMSSIYKILQETFLGIRVVKAFTMEPYERRRFNTATKDYYYKSMIVVNIDALSGPIIELLGVIAVAAALLAGAYLVLNNETHFGTWRMTDKPLDAAALLQLYALLAAIADPVRKLSSVYTKLQAGTAASDRIFAYLDKEPKVRANIQGVRLGRHQNSIEFRDVCFSYEPGRPILTNIQLSFRFGETVALVGKNGCGKSTLVGLIPRFFDPDHGSILIDGIDTRKCTLRGLRKQIGLVSQDTVLFDDTIFNNIAYGHYHAHQQDVEAAAKQTYIHDYIVSLPKGYETRLGEAGAKLSGGQKQRIALARAILRDPSILILDEFTSQCDAESEALIHRALRGFLRDRTTFVITHRLNTLEIADRIVVLDNGHVEAVGSHKELLASCSLYQRLHDAHFLREVA